MVGITANVQRTGQSNIDIVFALCRAIVISSGYFWLLLSLYVRNDDCVIPLIPWGVLSPFISVYTDKGERC